MHKTSKRQPTDAVSAVDGAPTGGDTAQARAYAVLRQAVLAGEFRLGEVVTLRALARRFDLGEMPVREALRRLTSEGAFEALPNRSARVPLLTRRDIEQIQELRQTLESQAAAAAARNITLGQIEHLRSLQAEMEKCLRSDPRRYSALNMAFHFEIYRIADNPLLLTLIQMLWLRMAPVVAGTSALLGSKSAQVRRAGLQSHEQLLDALVSRDAAAAEAAMRRDLSHVMSLDGYWDAVLSGSGA